MSSALDIRQTFHSITFCYVLAKTDFLACSILSFAPAASSLWDIQNTQTKLVSFADCHRGQSLIVTAISEGRQAARQIDLDLMGETSLAGPGGQVHRIKPIPKEIELSA